MAEDWMVPLVSLQEGDPVALLQGEDFKGDRAANLAKYLCQAPLQALP